MFVWLFSIDEEISTAHDFGICATTLIEAGLTRSHPFFLSRSFPGNFLLCRPQNVLSAIHRGCQSTPSNDGFVNSMALGYMLNDGLTGCLLGGNLAGGLVGDAMNNTSALEYEASPIYDSSPSYDSTPTHDSSSSFDGGSDFGGRDF